MAKVFQAVGNAVTSVVKGVVNVVKGVVNAVVSVAKSVINMVVQPFMGLLGGAPDIPTDAGEAARQQGVLVQVNGGGAVAIPVIYGYRKVAGVTTFAETGATNNKYLWVVYTFAEGPVGGLREVFLNDEALPGTIVTSLNSGVQVDIAEGKYKGRVSMLWSPGVYFTSPSTSTLGTTLKNGLFKDAPSFTSTMTHNGLAALFVRYEWIDQATANTSDTNPFNGSIPVMQISVLGRGVASLTTTASESYEYGASGYSERYSTNPAEILLDYLRNPRYGKGLKNSEIDWASWRIAAAKCNTQVKYTASNIQGPIMTCNYVLDTSQSIFNNVKILLAGFRAYMPYVQGKFKLKIEDAGHPTDILSGNATIVATCTSSYVIRDESLLENQYDIMGDVTYTGIERSAKYNAVIVTYVDPDQKWSNQQVVYPVDESERQSYITIDGGRENKLEATFPTLTNSAIAWDFAKILFNKSRFQESCSIKVSSQAFELEPGDNIRIQSQILDFGSIPWRVVTIGYNDDYTFDLGCVRNPDTLYPYTRVGEPDTVLPIYVPKGASIYYPVELDALPIGLYPPSSALYTTGYTGTTLNPIIAGTPGASGGGVGYANSSVNTGGVNNIPPGAPKPQPLTDALDITNVQYVTKNNIIYARITTKQPAHAMYAGVDIYYGLNNTKGFYTLVQDTQRPGTGVSFTIDIGPLAVISSLQASANQYVAYFRVKYSTGQASEKFDYITLNPATNENAGINPSELIQNTSSSWPTLTIGQAGARDNKFVICRVLVNKPQSALRTATIEVSQDIQSQTYNPDVDGVNIYAKSDASAFWTKTSYKFTNYVPGSLTSFAYTGYLGALGTGVDAYGTIPSGGAIYTFVFRFTYIDGSESTQQFVATGKVENPNYSNATGINIFAGIGIASDSTVAKTGAMSVADLAITLEPPSAASSALATQMSVDTTFTTSTTGVNLVMIAPNPLTDLWQGIRVRHRPVQPGKATTITPQDFTSYTDLKTFAGTGGVNYAGTYTVPGTNKDTLYEMVITPLVRANGLNYQEANVSSYGTGLVSLTASSPTQSQTASGSLNWASQWRWQQIDTGIATGSLNKTFSSANPAAIVNSCIGIRKASDASNFAVREHIELKYDCSQISGFVRLNVYRRTFNAVPSGTLASYYNIGRWERVQTTTSSGTLNLRLPISHKEFDRYYQVSGYATTNTTLTRGYDQLLTSASGSYPSGLAADNSTNTNSRSLVPLDPDFSKVQLLLIVETSTGASNMGLLIKGQLLNGDGQINFLQNLNGQSALPVPVQYQSATDTNAQWIRDTDFPNVNSVNYLRKLGDARTAQVSVDDIVYFDNAGGSAIGHRKTPNYFKTLSATLPGSPTAT